MWSKDMFMQVQEAVIRLNEGMMIEQLITLGVATVSCLVHQTVMITYSQAHKYLYPWQILT